MNTKIPHLRLSLALQTQRFSFASELGNVTCLVGQFSRQRFLGSARKFESNNTTMYWVKAAQTRDNEMARL